MDLNAILTETQKQVVEAPEGPVLILAGAGSGKTRVLTYRIAHFITQKNIPAESILALTFTNKAANEMRERIALLCQDARFFHLGTFHALCVKLLRREIQHLGYSPDFVIYAESEQTELLRGLIKKLNLSETRFTPNAAKEVISYAKNQSETPQLPTEYQNLYQLYQQALKKNHALDFDDLLNFTIKLFAEFPERLAHYQKKFRHILVDEYQDVNPAQYKLIRQLSGQSNNLTVVGDDDQSIYSFRGADVSIILRFEQDFPNAQVFKLEENFRSQKPILDVANALVCCNRRRKLKQLFTQSLEGELPELLVAFDPRDEARKTAETVRQLKNAGFSFGDMAVLYRVNSQSRAFEEAFITEGLPYRMYGGLRFYDRKEIKDLLSWLYFILNPADWVAFGRLVKNFLSGVGEKALEEIQNLMDTGEINSLEACERAEELSLSAHAKHQLTQFAGQIREYQKLAKMNQIKDLLEKIIKEARMEERFLPLGEAEARQKMENLLEFLGIAVEYQEDNPENDLYDFVQHIALYSETDKSDEEGAVNFLTLHAAKGLEFPVVFLAGLEEGLLPYFKTFDNPHEIEEERRLCYVGITRAEKKLFISYCENRALGGKTHTQRKSRFLEDIPAELLKYPAAHQPCKGKARPKKSVFFGESPKAAQAFNPGDRVVHKIFGTGEIVSATPNQARVVFGKLGEKLLDPSFLRLEENQTGAKEEKAAEPESRPTPRKPAQDVIFQENFGLGDRVEHAEMGNGIVKRIYETQLDVIFPGHGTNKVHKSQVTKCQPLAPAGANRNL